MFSPEPVYKMASIMLMICVTLLTLGCMAYFFWCLYLHLWLSCVAAIISMFWGFFGMAKASDVVKKCFKQREA